MSTDFALSIYSWNFPTDFGDLGIDKMERTKRKSMIPLTDLISLRVAPTHDIKYMDSKINNVPKSAQERSLHKISFDNRKLSKRMDSSDDIDNILGEETNNQGIQNKFRNIKLLY